MRFYSDEAVKKLESDVADARKRLDLAMMRANSVAAANKTERSREYLTHGFGRRIGILGRCLDRTFEIFPPSREELLSHQEALDIGICLHAFIINVNGVLDNLAWAFVHASGLADTLRKFEVGLFLDSTLVHLPDHARCYLLSDEMKAWHNEYSKNFRDALAHRVPPYVPPSGVLPDGRERIVATFLHSYEPSEGSRQMVLHAQLVADSLTVTTVSGKLLDAIEHAA